MCCSTSRLINFNACLQVLQITYPIQFLLLIRFKYKNFCQTVLFSEVLGISSNLLSSRSLQTSLEEKFMFLLKVIKAAQNKLPRYVKFILTKCSNILF